jgi:DNA polymerase I-like protein with 3'-5' exonuclease and polymerase domains
MVPGKKPHYYAFGHPHGNNCDFTTAHGECLEAARSKDGILCQNGKFDVDVAETWMKIPRFAWDRVHDSMFLLFLDNPHAYSLSLRRVCQDLLGIPAAEKNEVGLWLIANQKRFQEKLGGKRLTLKNFGAYISLAPAELVGRRAIGDVERTWKVFELLYPKIVEQGMLPAYDRERKLMRKLLDTERRGVPVNVDALEVDVAKYNKVLMRIDQFLWGTLGEINLDSGQQLTRALIDHRLVRVDKMKKTEKGAWASGADDLKDALADPALYKLFKYRGQLQTYVGTFMEPWLRTASGSGGLIYTDWAQTRQASGERQIGARTGRLSSSPNFQNIPDREFDYFSDDTSSPRNLVPKLPPLPRCRRYIVPPKGHILIDRDQSQAEPRILGHFEDGALLAQYQADPWTDVHDFAKERVCYMTGRDWDRRPIKDTNLGLIYGMGIDKLAAKSGVSKDDARLLKQLIMDEIYPGIGKMYKDMKLRATRKEPIITWGGRVYYCEAPRIVKGKIREYDYKLLNTLIQGSSADCLKEIIIRYHEMKHEDDTFLLSVHDELLCSVPAKRFVSGMETLRAAMESVEFDVPMLTEGEWSATSWEDMEPYDKRGELIYKGVANGRARVGR